MAISKIKAEECRLNLKILISKIRVVVLSWMTSAKDKRKAPYQLKMMGLYEGIILNKLRLKHRTEPLNQESTKAILEELQFKKYNKAMDCDVFYGVHKGGAHLRFYFIGTAIRVQREHYVNFKAETIRREKCLRPHIQIDLNYKR